MSKTQQHPEQSDGLEPEDPTELIEEHRDLFERIVDADLPISDRLEQAMESVEEDDAW